MCGIAGLITPQGRSPERDQVLKMADAIAHRGPDSHGIWLEGQAGLAHRRLAIVDLTPSGAQPMISDDGRYVVTFNGEIYNYQEIREQLAAEGKQLRSTSDTEILLVLYVMEGERMLTHLRGMFAFAIWDKEKRELFFARDRIGKKPFFYKNGQQGFSFASELKALHGSGKPMIDTEAIKLFLGLQYVPSPLTGFKDIFSLEPGMCGVWKDGALDIHSYLETAPIEAPSFSDAATRVRELLAESVRLRLIADVPVGIFLSGGIDSSAVAVIAHEQGAKLSSFTLGFDEAAFDERDQAAALARQFGFEHHAFLAKPEDMLAIADEVIAHYDAPYADSSALNTWLLARETKKHVKAVLTGDGGDELFGGYRRYQHYAKALQAKQFGLGGAVRVIADLAHRHTHDPRYARFAATLDGGYATLFCGAYFQQPEAVAFINQQLKSKLDPIAAAMDFDLRSYLPDDLNVKMDRASMAHGLEARSPFLDQELVSYATQLPTEYRFQAGKTKPLLVEAVKDLLSSDITRRPKRGFQVPLASWFRGPLRPAFVERCLESARVHQYVSKTQIEQLLSENDRGSDHGNRLWMLYSLATWLKRYE